MAHCCNPSPRTDCKIEGSLGLAARPPLNTKVSTETVTVTGIVTTSPGSAQSESPVCTRGLPELVFVPGQLVLLPSWFTSAAVPSDRRFSPPLCCSYTYLPLLPQSVRLGNPWPEKPVASLHGFQAKLGI